MSNFRLKVFHSVAVHLNFTKAAEELYISQPAVTKNIKELETELDAKLFDRLSNNVALTEAGRIVFDYAEHVLELDKKLAFDLSTLKQKYAGQLKLGASTTIGQYILPSILAKFHERHTDIALMLLNDNTEKIERALLRNEIDLGIVEGSSKNNQIKYIPFIKDEIVAIAHTSQPLSEQDEISLSELKSLPLVLREAGSGSLEVILKKLKEQGIRLQDLHILMHLGSTEGIKTYLANSNCLGLISINAVSKEIANGKFKVIDIKDFEIERMFYFIHTHGKLSGLAEMFMRFIQQAHN
ncbi:Transcriptional regulator, LysR family [uncultured Dysgonomonas sp.]|uniref:Transcriptional regulator, LysR family n=1 Tax=uncultured Dysgonomonas sp. TaxID=206096 RepID=A0A212IZK8_9BACT|nr:selenium metabolism-associated LysR family transcriptional regulator [uncultured Dysgonomonas sp.]SBV92658.1 Transcriptional regulator, LysR family [uncultured Dysgonomonas sp.]